MKQYVNSAKTCEQYIQYNKNFDEWHKDKYPKEKIA